MNRRLLLVAALVLISSSNRAADGEKTLDYDFGQPLQTAPAVDNDGTIYVGGSGTVAAVNPEGGELWKAELSEGSTSTIGGITVGSEHIYVTGAEGVFALTKTGTKVWTNGMDTSSSAVALDANGNLYVGTRTGHLYSLKPDGTERWSELLEPPAGGIGPILPLAAPSINLEGTVFARASATYLFARENDGSGGWSEIVAFGNPMSVPITEAGLALVMEQNSANIRVRGVGPGGAVSLNSDSLVGGLSSAPVAGPDGTIYVPMGPGIFPAATQGFTALDSAGGAKWSYPLESVASAAVAADNTVFVAGEGKIVAINPNGTLRWAYTNNSEVAQGLSIAPNGTILAAQADGKLIGLQSSSPLAHKGWPVFGGNAKHTFRQRLAVALGTPVVSEITAKSARFTAQVNTASRPATVYFEYSDGATLLTTEGEMLAGSSLDEEVTETVAGLVEGTFYTVRLVLSNALEVVRSAPSSFQTSGDSGEAPPTLATLQAAAEAGGTVKFSGPGTIAITTPIEFTADAEIDANGHPVTLGGNGHASLIRMGAGRNLTFRGLTVINGGAAGALSETTETLAQGGAILNSGGNLTLIDCVFSNNAAIGDFAASSANWSSELPTRAAGGAIWQEGGTLTIVNSTFSNNHSRGGRGSYMPDVGEARGGAIYAREAVVQITGSSFTANQTMGGIRNFVSTDLGNSEGGAIYVTGTLSVSDSRFSGNYAVGGELAAGGAITFGEGQLTIQNSSFDENVASGVLSSSPLFGGRFSPAAGAALFVTGTAVVEQSTFLRNRSYAEGHGAIYNGGTFTLVNSTLAENSAFTLVQPAGLPLTTNAGAASAIFNAGSLGVTNSTIAFNQDALATIAGGENVILKNTLLAFNQSPNGTNLIDAGHNLSSDSTPSFTESTSRNNTDPKLGPLGLYGGTTPVYPLFAGSPAIDSADDSAAPEIDQRGRSRPYGDHADIGSFESSAPFLVWGRIRGYHDASTQLTFATTEITPDPLGNFELGFLPAGNLEITLTAENAWLRPNPWTLDVVADGPVTAPISFEHHSFAFDLDFEQPTFTLAGFEGETYCIESSTDLKAWTELGTYTVDQTGLVSITIINPGDTLFLRPVPVPE